MVQTLKHKSTAAVLLTLAAMMLIAAGTGVINWTQINSVSRHGTAAYGQASDGTGASGDCAKFNSNGSLTDAGAACGGSMTYPGSGVPNSTGSAWGTSYSVQGTDSTLLSSGTVSGTGSLLCLDSNGGATTSGCAGTGGGSAVSIWSGSGNPNGAQTQLAPTNMTTDNTPTPFVASASSNYSATPPYLAFANSSGGNGCCDWTGTGSGTDWLQIFMSSAITVYSYGVHFDSGANPLARAPRNWTMQGSSDGTSWTVVDTETNQTSWSYGQTRVFVLSSSQTYAYWRISITANNGDATYTSICSLYLYSPYSSPFTGGSLGDFYIQPPILTIYGPKTSGSPAWPVRGTLN